MELLLGEQTGDNIENDRDEPVVARGRRRIADLGLQVGLIAVAGLLYFGVRYVTTGSRAAAVDNARKILDLEALVGVDIEQSVQTAILGSKAIVNASNWIYMWAHWPVIIGTFAWLYFRSPLEYTKFRNALFVSGAIGLIVFALFPVAPPRLLHDGFVDTITELSSTYRVLQPPSLVNEYAAVPSFHVGWNILAAIFLWRNIKSRWVRPLTLVSPIAMTLAVVLTANHYVFDAAAGAAVCLFGLWAGARLARTRWPILGAPRLT